MRRSIVLVALLLGSPAGAEDGLSLSANIRVRYETISGQARAGLNAADDLLALRTILGAEYRKNGLRIGAELHDSRVYVDSPGAPITTNEVNALEPVQAYIAYEMPHALGPGRRLALQAGRFTLNLGSRRLVAADDYRNTTNGYTGIRADIGLGANTTATAIYTLPHQRLPDDPRGLDANRVRLDREGFDLVLWGGLVSAKPASAGPVVELSYYHFGERDRSGRATRDRSLDSVGLRVYREPSPGKADLEAEFIHQSGTISASLAPASARLPVSAWFLHLETGHSLPGPWSPRVSLEFDYASGDGPGGKNGRFDTLFGMRRAELAPSGLYNAVGRTNMVSPAVRLEAAPSKRLDGFVAWRPLWLAARTDSFSTTGVRDPSGASGRFVGHQIEGRIRYWLAPGRMRLDVNALVLAKGRFLREAPNAPSSGNTRYLALDASVFF